MPILTGETFIIDVKEDKSIEITFIEELLANGCKDIPVSDSIKDAALALSGKGLILCDDDLNMCCVKPGSYPNLVIALRNLRGGEQLNG